MDYAIQELTDGERIVLSANLLDTSEFEIFRHAYEEWYGQQAAEETLRSEFSHYLHTSHAPPWVRHYARLLLKQTEQTIQLSAYRPPSSRLFGWLLNTRVARLIFG